MAQSTRSCPSIASSRRAASLVVADLVDQVVDPGEVLWTVDSVRATFLRDGELVPSVRVGVDEDAAGRRHREAVAELAAASRAQSTRLAYGRHVEVWLRWADEHQLCPLPADPDDVAQFVVGYALVLDGEGAPVRDDEGHLQGRVVFATVKQFGAALTRLHVLASLPSPLADPRAREVVRGLRRTLTSAPLRAKAALTWDLLVEVLEGGDALASGGALRAELARALHRDAGATAGQLARLSWTEVDLSERCAVLRLPSARRGAVPVWVTVRASGGPLCPVLLLRRWRDATARWPGSAVFRDATGKPLTRQGLHKILGAQPVSVERVPPVLASSAADVRDRALLLVGWNSALRRSNLASLTWDQMHRTAVGWTAYVSKSKTDQARHGATVGIPAPPAGSGMPDAVQALDAWLAVVTRVVGCDPRKMVGAPVFCPIDRYGTIALTGGRLVSLSGSAVGAIVQRRVQAAGLEDREHLTQGGRSTAPGLRSFGAHSMRAGWITEALLHDVPGEAICAQTGHTDTSALMPYFKPAVRADLLAASAVLSRIAAAGNEDVERVSGPRVAVVSRRARRAVDWASVPGAVGD